MWFWDKKCKSQFRTTQSNTDVNNRAANAPVSIVLPQLNLLIDFCSSICAGETISIYLYLIGTFKEGWAYDWHSRQEICPKYAHFILPDTLLNVLFGQNSGSSVPSGQKRPGGHTFALAPWFGVADLAPVKTKK